MVTLTAARQIRALDRGAQSSRREFSRTTPRTSTNSLPEDCLPNRRPAEASRPPAERRARHSQQVRPGGWGNEKRLAATRARLECVQPACGSWQAMAGTAAGESLSSLEMSHRVRAKNIRRASFRMGLIRWHLSSGMTGGGGGLCGLPWFVKLRIGLNLPVLSRCVLPCRLRR